MTDDHEDRAELERRNDKVHTCRAALKAERESAAAAARAAFKADIQDRLSRLAHRARGEIAEWKAHRERIGAHAGGT